MNIIDELKKYMVENNLRQVDIAKMLGVRKQRVSDWMRGICKPRAVYCEKIWAMVSGKQKHFI